MLSMTAGVIYLPQQFLPPLLLCAFQMAAIRVSLSLNLICIPQ